MKILVVEDDVTIQNMYKLKLEYEGYEVLTANNGIEGLAMVEEHNPKLVLLDLRMPKMNGDEMLIRMRETRWGSYARVIVLTNISKNEAPDTLRFLGVDRYIVKAHHTPKQLVEIIHEVLDGYK